MSSQEAISVLFLGDIIGKPGRRVVNHYLKTLTERPDLVIANAENCAHGFGLTEGNMKELMHSGVAVLTGGNHTFDRKEIFGFIDEHPYLLRPANYPEGTPGKGWCTYDVAGVPITIINLQGRVFMEPLNSPFAVADQILEKVAGQSKIIFVDVHAEATAEKIALGWYLSGRVSAVIGTHTHVQTADERILPGGTAYITDAGCCGPADGVIGMDRTSVMRRMVQQLPARFEVAPGPAQLNGVRINFDKSSGQAISITRVQYKESEAPANENDEE
jgi:2',3'-cyclic-nucleotide 2'-phosphodiesterase